MDEFVGYMLRYQTQPNKDCIGILRKIEEEQNILVFEDITTKLMVRVSIDSIRSMELAEECSNLSAGTPIKTKNADENGSKDTKTTNLYAENTKITETDKMHAILEDCFNCYFPTEEQFNYITAHNSYKIINTIFKTESADKVALIIGGDDFFTRLGYLTAIYLHNYNYKVDVFACDLATSPLTSATLQRFRNCGLKSLDKLDYKYKTVLVSSKNGYLSRPVLKKISYENIVYLDLPEKKGKESANSIGIVYAIKTERILTFCGRVVCIDIGVPDLLLYKYGVKRNYDKALFYVN